MYVEMLFTRDPNNIEFNVVHIRIYRGYPVFTFSIFPLPLLMLLLFSRLESFICLLKSLFLFLGKKMNNLGTDWEPNQNVGSVCI